MNESSEVKVHVRCASNLSGRSIKRKLQRRKSSTLYSTWVGIVDVESVVSGRRLVSIGKKYPRAPIESTGVGIATW